MGVVDLPRSELTVSPKPALPAAIWDYLVKSEPALESPLGRRYLERACGGTCRESFVLEWEAVKKRIRASI
ncbi:MAG: hypothetical protein V2B18_04700 [Pseudomonadota bacterium]